MKWYRSASVRRLTGVTKRKKRHSREDDECKNKVISVIDDVMQNHARKSKKDMLKVFGMAYEFLVAGVCSSDDPVDVEAEEEEEAEVPPARAPKRRASKKKNPVDVEAKEEEPE